MDHQYRQQVTDGVISNVPVEIFGIVFTASSSGASTVSLYDGENNGEQLIMTLSAVVSRTVVIPFSVPLKTRRGLYLDAGSNVESLVIQFKAHAE